MTDPVTRGGPWTPGDLDGLPGGQRYEIVDGSLLVSPLSAPKHQLVAGRLAAVLRESAPAGMDVVEAVGVRLGSGRLAIPDVVVAASSALVGDDATLAPADVSLVVEVVSPSNAAMDRVFKPQLYAAAGIRWMWRAEMGQKAVELVVLELTGGAAVERARSTGALRVDLPYPVDLPVDRLLIAR